jgi:hypothetical protein
MKVINPVKRVYERVYGSNKPLKRVYERVFESLMYAKKGFIIRCTFINPLRVYYSTLFFTV